MERADSKSYLLGFVPYALAAFLIGIIGGFGLATPVYGDLKDKPDRR